MLNIQGLTERGESFYNPYLEDVVTTLLDQGLAVESEGTIAVFLDGVSLSVCSASCFSFCTQGCVFANTFVSVQKQRWDCTADYSTEVGWWFQLRNHGSRSYPSPS